MTMANGYPIPHSKVNTFKDPTQYTISDLVHAYLTDILMKKAVHWLQVHAFRLATNKYIFIRVH